MQVSLVIGVAVKSQREEAGWSEGVAIWVAVFIVSLVGQSRIHRLQGTCISLSKPVSLLRQSYILVKLVVPAIAAQHRHLSRACTMELSSW